MTDRLMTATNPGRAVAAGVMPGAWKVNQVVERPQSGSVPQVESRAEAWAVFAARQWQPVSTRAGNPRRRTTKAATGALQTCHKGVLVPRGTGPVVRAEAWPHATCSEGQAGCGDEMATQGMRAHPKRHRFFGRKAYELGMAY